MADTLEGTNCVAAVGMIITRIIIALVDVLLTVSTLEAVRTFFASNCLVAHSVNIMTVAITKTILAPSAAGAGCIKGRNIYLLVSADVIHTYSLTWRYTESTFDLDEHMGRIMSSAQ